LAPAGYRRGSPDAGGDQHGRGARWGPSIVATEDETRTTIAASQAAVSTWARRLLSALVALALLADAASVLFFPSMTHAEFAAAGFADSAAPPLGIIMLVCAILYAIPRTAVLGAILVTGFLGEAICTHFRLGETSSPPQIVSLVRGLMTCGGLYLRNALVRSLLPFTPS
jgi:hypothetical protein